MASRIKQIAEIAQVSPATVSLALNNKPGVSPVTRERILSIAETLKSSNGAQGFNQLIKGSVRFLKIVKHSHIVNRDHDVFIAAYIEGMDKEARKHGYNLEITHITLDQIRRVRRPPQLLLLQGADRAGHRAERPRHPGLRERQRARSWSSTPPSTSSGWTSWT